MRSSTRKKLLLFCIFMTSACQPGGSTSDTPQQQPQALECGQASYYADKFAGRSTASGELYAPEKFTAAHKTLAFGTKLRVVHQDTNAEVIVTVNDRGPFTPNRIIDLSRAGAEKIGMIDQGVASVCIFER